MISLPRASRRSVLLALGAALASGPALSAIVPGDKATSILVLKARRAMFLMKRGEIMKRYCIGLGREPVGAKLQQGDLRTPEGFYTIDGRNADSRYHRALHISYPNEDDLIAARRARVDPGGNIEIHGFPETSESFGPYGCSSDWTDGCIAVKNPDIEEIWSLVDDGTLVEIRK